MMEFSCRELKENGVSIVSVKTGINTKKLLLSAENFEKAHSIYYLFKKAYEIKRWEFKIKKVVESWDRRYYSLSLNGGFMLTDSSLQKLKDIINKTMNKLCIKDFVVEIVI